MKCPSCGLINPVGAQRCDCGYDFATGSQQDSFIEPPAIRNAPSGLQTHVQRESVSAVVVTDIKMPFSSMVVFMVKWAVASIPATIILVLAAAVAIMLFGGVISEALRPL